MKKIGLSLTDIGRSLVIGGLLFALTGCRAPQPTTRQTSPRPKIPPPAVVEVNPLIAPFAIRSWDQNGTRPNARGETVKTYEIHMQNPEFSGSTFAALNRLIRSFILESKRDFNQSTMDVDISRLDEAGFPWNLDIKFKIYYNSTRLVSLLFIRTMASGGPHPVTDFYSINYDVAQQKEVFLTDMLISPAALDHLSALVISRLKQQPNWVANDQVLQRGAGPVAENFACFTLAPGWVSLHFPPEQVAEYASGAQHVTLPLNELASWLRPEVITWLNSGRSGR
jgi:hypothetical protein